jgi:hypothetical protein
VARLQVALDRLLGQISHWTPSRFAVAASVGMPRGDVLYGLVQYLADLGADAGGQPRRVVPRLDTDTALPHQLAVVATDLLAAGSPADLAAGADAITAAARTLD